MKAIVTLTALSLAASFFAADEAMKNLYFNDFEKSEVGAEPEGVLVQNGEWTVQEDGATGKALQLAGTPLDTMGISFGPSRGVDVTITAVIRGEKKGRLMPSFGVGLGGPQGYRLILSPQRDRIELMRGDEVIDHLKYEDWKSGEWTGMRLTIRQFKEGAWEVWGRAWSGRNKEISKTWLVAIDTTVEPPNGKASLWGMPYSGLPILYDNVAYETTE